MSDCVIATLVVGGLLLLFGVFFYLLTLSYINQARKYVSCVYTQVAQEEYQKGFDEGREAGRLEAYEQAANDAIQGNL